MKPHFTIFSISLPSLPFSLSSLPLTPSVDHLTLPSIAQLSFPPSPLIRNHLNRRPTATNWPDSPRSHEFHLSRAHSYFSSLVVLVYTKNCAHPLVPAALSSVHVYFPLSSITKCFIFSSHWSYHRQKSSLPATIVAINLLAANFPLIFGLPRVKPLSTAILIVSWHMQR